LSLTASFTCISKRDGIHKEKSISFGILVYRFSGATVSVQWCNSEWQISFKFKRKDDYIPYTLAHAED
jgi:hypothetical protein